MNGALPSFPLFTYLPLNKAIPTTLAVDLTRRGCKCTFTCQGQRMLAQVVLVLSVLVTSVPHLIPAASSHRIMRQTANCGRGGGVPWATLRLLKVRYTGCGGSKTKRCWFMLVPYTLPMATGNLSTLGQIEGEEGLQMANAFLQLQLWLVSRMSGMTQHRHSNWGLGLVPRAAGMWLC